METLDENTSNKLCIDELKEIALQLINCPHSLCSLNEAICEEIYGNMILNIIKKYKD